MGREWRWLFLALWLCRRRRPGCVCSPRGTERRRGISDCLCWRAEEDMIWEEEEKRALVRNNDEDTVSHSPSLLFV